MTLLRRPTAIRLLIALLVGVGAVLLVGSAIAADNTGLTDFHPVDERAPADESVIAETTTRETIVIEATLRSDGGYQGEGLKSVNQTIAYDPEVLTLTDIERGPWLEQGTETEIVVSSSIDNEAGRATIEQVRSPVDGGATGEGTTAVLTFEIADEAPPSDAYLQYESVGLMLKTDVPVNAVPRERAIRIDGGGEERVPLAEEDEENEDDGPGVVTPDDQSAGGDADGEIGSEPEPKPEPESDSQSEPEPDDQTGFGVVATLLALLVAIGIRRQTA